MGDCLVWRTFGLTRVHFEFIGKSCVAMIWRNTTRKRTLRFYSQQYRHNEKGLHEGRLVLFPIIFAMGESLKIRMRG